MSYMRPPIPEASSRAARRGKPPRRLSRTTVLAIAASFLAACSASTVDAIGAPNGVTGNADAATRAQIEAVARDAMAAYSLRALIIRATIDGQDVYTAAMGESLSGMPATPDMHFRNGAFAFTYIGEVFAKLVDAGSVSLDAKLATWFPELPRANQITVKNLLNMTSGYADYVYQPVILDSLNIDPFRQWTSDELVAIGMSAPEQFAPGTNWGYSHTNYVILGKVLEKITQKPLADVMQEYIFRPMKLTATSDNGGTAFIPEPVLHVYSSERRSALSVPANKPFYEESTYWNPSWTTANGAVQTTNIFDVTTSMEIVGSGAQVSPAMYREQVEPRLIGFGHKDSTGACSACSDNTVQRSYGLGVVLIGPWITQTKNFAGSGATSGYLPSKKLTISVATTYSSAAFTDDGSYSNSSNAVFKSLAAVLAPGQLPDAVQGR